MSFRLFGDYASVKFTGLSKIFDVPATAFTVELFGKSMEVKWYGIIIAFGFTLAVLFGGRMAYKWKMDINKMLDVLIYGTFCGIVGARLYYVFSNWGFYSESPMQILNLRGGGLAIYGGLIGGLIGAFVTCRFNKLNFYNLLDLAGMSFLIGQGIGRWGNFMNQEAFGINTDRPWGMWSEKVADYIITHQSELAGVDPTKPVHPTFLYESIWCLVGFGLLYLICRRARKFSGQIMLCYGVWYGLGRFFFEGLRTDSLYLGDTGIRTSQLLSALLVLGCGAVLIAKYVKYTKHPRPIEGIDFFPQAEDKSKGKAEPKLQNDVMEAFVSDAQAEEIEAEDAKEDTSPDTETAVGDSVKDTDVTEEP